MREQYNLTESPGDKHQHVGIYTTIPGECFDCRKPLPTQSRAIFDVTSNRVFCLNCAPANEEFTRLTDEQEQALAAAIAGSVALATTPQ